ncbi:MAG TPA: AtpZ/AtpI family protein [Candidatus Saccharimonadales bacterium]|nr:AtpZ/AtpI family protein [Candidatus Saccharimonadales bacterium]
MSTAADPTTKSSRDNNAFSLGALARDLLDTTWRVITPTLLFAGAGLLIDMHAPTKPWMTLAGAAFGLFCAALLIKRQLRAVNGKESK